MRIKVSNRTANALQKLRELSKTSEDKVEYFLAEKGNATIYDISKNFGWTVGKTGGIVRRMLKKNIIKLFDERTENEKLKKYYELVPAEEILAD